MSKESGAGRGYEISTSSRVVTQRDGRGCALQQHSFEKESVGPPDAGSLSCR